MSLAEYNRLRQKFRSQHGFNPSAETPLDKLRESVQRFEELEDGEHESARVQPAEERVSTPARDEPAEGDEAPRAAEDAREGEPDEQPKPQPTTWNWVRVK